MTLKNLIDLAENRELSKSYPKADGLYIWDYKINKDSDLELIVSNSGKTGFKDKVSIEELVNYVLDETNPETSGDQVISQMRVVGAEGLTIAKI
jgi:hypothetical protein